MENVIITECRSKSYSGSHLEGKPGFLRIAEKSYGTTKMVTDKRGNVLPEQFSGRRCYASRLVIEKRCPAIREIIEKRFYFSKVITGRKHGAARTVIIKGFDVARIFR